MSGNFMILIVVTTVGRERIFLSLPSPPPPGWEETLFLSSLSGAG